MLATLDKPSDTEAVPFAARHFRHISAGSPFPAGTTLCPVRQVSVLPNGTPLVETDIITAGSGCWEKTLGENLDFHGDD